MSEKVFSKCLTKYKVAELFEVSPSTLADWLNNLYFDELEKIGYRKNSKILNPKILNYLAEKLDLQPESKENQ